MLEAIEAAGAFLEQAAPLLGDFVQDSASTAADAAAEEAGQMAVRGSAAGGLALWRRIRGQAEKALPGGAEELDVAARAAADAPDDEEATRRLQEQVSAVLASAPTLVEEAAAWSGVAGDYAGPRAVQTRDVSNSTIITGDGNRVG